MDKAQPLDAQELAGVKFGSWELQMHSSFLCFVCFCEANWGAAAGWGGIGRSATEILSGPQGRHAARLRDRREPHRHREAPAGQARQPLRRGLPGEPLLGSCRGAVNPRTKSLEFQSFDSVRFSISMGGIPTSRGDSPEISIQRFLVCGLAVWTQTAPAQTTWTSMPTPSPWTPGQSLT